MDIQRDTVFAEQEGTAIVNGDGTSKPKGFLAYTTVADSAWSWANLGYIATGAPGAFKTTGASDTLIDTIFAEGGASAERQLRHEPQDAGRGPQVEGW